MFDASFEYHVPQYVLSYTDDYTDASLDRFENLLDDFLPSDTDTEEKDD